MSGQIGGQSHALPFTGLTSLPLVVVGLVVSAIGALLTLVRSKKSV